MRLAAVPGVVAVTLGGSRATNTAVEGSDWDFGLYYRDRLDPADIVALGWPGRVFAPVKWGPARLGQPDRDLGTLMSDVQTCLGLRDAVWIDE